MVFIIIQIVVALLLIVVIILQNRGANSSMAYGGGAQTTYRSKKGLERLLFYATIVLSAIFAAVSILSVIA